MPIEAGCECCAHFTGQQAEAKRKEGDCKAPHSVRWSSSRSRESDSDSPDRLSLEGLEAGLEMPRFPPPVNGGHSRQVVQQGQGLKEASGD